MAKNSQTPLSQPIGGWLIFIFIIWLVLASVTLANDQPIGEIALIDGRAIHYVENGNPDGDLTVILEAGGGAFSTFWAPMQDSLARDASGLRVISYDRAGFGWSDPRPGEYSIEEDADDLAALLAALETKTPVIIAAHSYGGFVAKLFADRFPERLGGVVLIDANIASFFANKPDLVRGIETGNETVEPRGLACIFYRKAVIRMLGGGDRAKLAYDRFASDDHQQRTRNMLAQFGRTVAAASNAKWHDLPMIVLSRGLRDKSYPWKTDALEQEWRDSHLRLVQNQPNAELRIANKSRHTLPYDEPEAVIEAIKEIADSKLR